MGFSKRAALNALRYSHSAQPLLGGALVDSALELLMAGYFDDEECNRAFEDSYLPGSPVDKAVARRRFDTLNWAFVQRLRAKKLAEGAGPRHRLDSGSSDYGASSLLGLSDSGTDGFGGLSAIGGNGLSAFALYRGGGLGGLSVYGGEGVNSVGALFGQFLTGAYGGRTETPTRPVIRIKEADVSPLFVGKGPLTAEQEGKIEDLAGKNRDIERPLRDLVHRIRSTGDLDDANFSNPFTAALGNPGSLEEQIFEREGLRWAATLTPKQCKYVLQKMSQGIDFSVVFDLMLQMADDIEQVEEILS
jgi:hypothetical protein